ncbi:hypothetical protein [uncultured Gulosibacter sp.]|uniref:hypothetical protein n=1 Tax=uncultured Gulosibacter sp. TaxID=1339167 RepID=UPI00288BF85D|nr:hypothetical protein [uncultured Gulosibacter sp.]
MRLVRMTAAAGIALMLTSCAATTVEVTPTESSAPSTQLPDYRQAAPQLPLPDAASMCATEIDSVVFLDVMRDGVSNRDGFDPHYDAELFNVTVVDGEWHFEFLPTHENIAAATCHTDGDQVVSMTRAEFEEAMKGRAYDGYVEVTE